MHECSNDDAVTVREEVRFFEGGEGQVDRIRSSFVVRAGLRPLLAAAAAIAKGGLKGRFDEDVRSFRTRLLRGHPEHFNFGI